MFQRFPMYTGQGYAYVYKTSYKTSYIGLI